MSWLAGGVPSKGANKSSIQGRLSLEAGGDRAGGGEVGTGDVMAGVSAKKGTSGDGDEFCLPPNIVVGHGIASFTENQENVPAGAQGEGDGHGEGSDRSSATL